MMSSDNDRSSLENGRKLSLDSDNNQKQEDNNHRPVTVEYLNNDLIENDKDSYDNEA